MKRSSTSRKIAENLTLFASEAWEIRVFRGYFQQEKTKTEEDRRNGTVSSLKGGNSKFKKKQ